MSRAVELPQKSRARAPVFGFVQLEREQRRIAHVRERERRLAYALPGEPRRRRRGVRRA